MKDTDTHFSKEIQMVNSSHQGNVNQNHSEMSFSIRMSVLKKTKFIKIWQGFGIKKPLTYCWCECKVILPQWRCIKKLTIDAPHSQLSPYPLLEIYPKELTSHNTDMTALPGYCSIIHNSQGIEST